MSIHRRPDARFATLPGFPFEPHYLEQDGLRMHYLDEGEGDPVSLLHGERTGPFLSPKTTPAPKASRAPAPDYFGCGRSDKPTDPAFYTYHMQVTSIARLAEELDLRDV